MNTNQAMKIMMINFNINISKKYFFCTQNIYFLIIILDMYVSKKYKNNNKFQYLKYGKYNIEKYYQEIPIIQKKLDDAKSKMDLLPSNVNTLIGKVRREYANVRYILMEKFNGHNISIGSMKFIEILYQYPELTNQKNKIISFHNSELPGGFITGMNHFMKTERKNIEWEWYGNSLIGDAAFTDEYSLYRLNKEKWMMDENNDGDMTNYKSITYSINKFKNIIPEGCDLYTSDLGIPGKYAYLYQEKSEYRPNIGQLIFALNIINKNGNMIFKNYTFLGLNTMFMFYLAAQYFETFEICKPLTSREGNSECYIVCLGFKGKPNDNEFKEMIKIIKIINEFPISYGGYIYKSIPDDFRFFLIDVFKELFLERQIKAIDNDILQQKNYIKYGESYLKSLKKKYENEFPLLVENYLKLYPYKKLSKEDQMKTQDNLSKNLADKLLKKNMDYSIDIKINRKYPSNVKKEILLVNVFSGCAIENNMCEIIKKNYNISKTINKENLYKIIIDNENVENYEKIIYINYPSILLSENTNNNIVYINGNYKDYRGNEWRNVDEILCSSNKTCTYFENLKYKITNIKYEYLIDPQFEIYKYISYTYKTNIIKNKKPIILFLDTVEDSINEIIEYSTNPIYIAINKGNDRTLNKIKYYGQIKKIKAIPQNHYKLYFPRYIDMNYFLDYFKKIKEKIITNSMTNSKSKNVCHMFNDRCIIKNLNIEDYEETLYK